MTSWVTAALVAVVALPAPVVGDSPVEGARSLLHATHQCHIAEVNASDTILSEKFVNKIVESLTPYVADAMGQQVRSIVREISGGLAGLAAGKAVQKFGKTGLSPIIRKAINTVNMAPNQTKYTAGRIKCSLDALHVNQSELAMEGNTPLEINFDSCVETMRASTIDVPPSSISIPLLNQGQMAFVLKMAKSRSHIITDGAEHALARVVDVEGLFGEYADQWVDDATPKYIESITQPLTEYVFGPDGIINSSSVDASETKILGSCLRDVLVNSVFASLGFPAKSYQKRSWLGQWQIALIALVVVILFAVILFVLYVVWTKSASEATPVPKDEEVQEDNKNEKEDQKSESEEMPRQVARIDSTKAPGARKRTSTPGPAARARNSGSA